MTAIGFALFAVSWFGLFVAAQMRMPFWLESLFSICLIGGSFSMAAGITIVLWKYMP